jgi:hypothetical protein
LELLVNGRKTLKIKEVQISQQMKKLKRVVLAELLLNLKIAKMKVHLLLNKFQRVAHPSVKKRSQLWLLNLLLLQFLLVLKAQEVQQKLQRKMFQMFQWKASHQQDNLREKESDICIRS